MKLPDGSWVGQPKLLRASAMGKLEPNSVSSSSRFSYNNFVKGFGVEVTADKSWLRSLYEGLPEVVRKTLKSQPTVPFRRLVTSQVEWVLVFPTDIRTPDKESRFFVALWDEQGGLGQGANFYEMELDDGFLAIPCVIPRMSKVLTLGAWKMGKDEYELNYKAKPVATMKFENPLLKHLTSAPLWPDGTKDLVKEWRGRTFTLLDAKRDEKKPETSFNIRVSAQLTDRDYSILDWYVKDNRGNFFVPRSKSFSTGGYESFVISSRAPLLWRENLNWCLGLCVVPANALALKPSEWRRVRIEMPKQELTEELVVAPPFELNGVRFKYLRLAPDFKPGRKFINLKLNDRYYTARLMFDVEANRPGVVVDVINFHDGVLPFHQRASEVSTVDDNIALPSGKMRRLAVDRTADFLEFVVTATSVETIEFKFQPKVPPDK